MVSALQESPPRKPSSTPDPSPNSNQIPRIFGTDMMPLASRCCIAVTTGEQRLLTPSADSCRCSSLAGTYPDKQAGHHGRSESNSKSGLLVLTFYVRANLLFIPTRVAFLAVPEVIQNLSRYSPDSYPSSHAASMCKRRLATILRVVNVQGHLA